MKLISLSLSVHPKSALFLVVFSSLDELQKTKYVCNCSVYSYLTCQRITCAPCQRIACASSLHRGEYLYVYSLNVDAERFSQSVLSTYQTTPRYIRERSGLHKGILFSNRGVKLGTAISAL
jgi:hypothetical protein